MDRQPLELPDLELITALQPTDWQNIIPSIEFYINSTFCFPIKLIIDNKIVGIGTTIIHNDIAWLAHIIVHPEHRNQGIGKIITQTLVDSLQTKCDTIYLIATDLGKPVYKKIGFETETEYLFFKDIQADRNWKISEGILPYADNFKPYIARLDRRVSGEDRLFHLEQYLGNSSVYVQNNIVEGFYLPSCGEGLITAITNPAGSELMKLRLMTNENAAFPRDNLTATAFMHQNNFKEFKRATRMRLGIKKRWQPANIYNRIAGNLG